MLPKIEHPLFKITIPSTKENVNVRPMLVKEEKILLMAKEGGEYSEILRAIKQVVNNCIQNYDIGKLAIFDIEYLFLKIRALSVDNIIKISYIDNDDNEEREFEIDLSQVNVDFSKKKENIIKTGKESGFTLRYPSSSLYDEELGNTESEIFDSLVIDCIVNYFNKDKVYNFKNETKEVIQEFINDNVDSKTYNKIKAFLDNVPSLKYDIVYKDKEGKEKTVTLKSLNDFFMF